jgi:hypothetical protein
MDEDFIRNCSNCLFIRSMADSTFMCDCESSVAYGRQIQADDFCDCWILREVV